MLELLIGELGPRQEPKKTRLDRITSPRCVALARRGQDPSGALFTWDVATNFLLREIELALLDLHSDTISFDVLASTVAVRLSASKGDPSGRTAGRTQMQVQHNGPSVFALSVCSAAFLVKMATASWTSLGGSGDRSFEEAMFLPEIGTCDSRCFVDKAHIIHTLKSDASLLVDQSGARLDISEVLSMNYGELELNTWQD